MENLGRNSKAIYRAYSKKARVTVPSLEEARIILMPEAKAV
jgi:hypothetical protein